MCMYSLHFNWKERNKTNFFPCRFNIVGQENLGNYSCTFGDEAGIDFAFRGKDPSKYICHITCSRLTKTVLFGFTSQRITTVILTIRAYDALCLVHKRHWTVNMATLWCDRALLTSRPFFQLHCWASRETSPSSAMWATPWWSCVRWRTANRSRATGRGTNTLSRWVSSSGEVSSFLQSKPQ